MTRDVRRVTIQEAGCREMQTRYENATGTGASERHVPCKEDDWSAPVTYTNIILFYVADVGASGRFYSAILGFEPVEASPTFNLFVLPSGLAIGLWGKNGVEPPPAATGGGSELGFKVKGAVEVESAYADWLSKGARIALPPTDLDFGRTFVALDPDGHRLRVYAAADEM